MAKKKTSKKKVAKKSSKKVAKKVAKKTAKKVTKKATKKTTKKATKRPAKKSRSLKESTFPTMDTDDSSDGFYSPPPVDTFSSSSDLSGISRPEEEETSSRKTAILAILVIVVLVVLVVIFKDKFQSPKPGVDDTTPISGINKKPGVGKKPVINPKYRTHKVVKGDTLGRIAKRYLKNAKRYREIMKLNNMKKASEAKPGRVLKIPLK